MKNAMSVRVMGAIFLLMFCYCAVSLAQTMTTRGDIFPVLSGVNPPEKNLLYKLDSVQVLQTIDGGVLINLIPSLSSELQRNADVAFLSTDEEFVDKAFLDHRWAYYTGQYKYQSLSGAEKNIYAFKMFNKDKGRDLNQRIEVSRNQEQTETTPLSELRTSSERAKAVDGLSQQGELSSRR
jgi:hypothetical protein